MLREFRLSEVSDERLKLIEPYVDNPVFRPENVISVSLCAAKFCGWVLGIVQAARWQRGVSHKRIDLVTADNNTSTNFSVAAAAAAAVSSSSSSSSYKYSDKTEMSSVKSMQSSSTENLTFVQKLERRRAKKQQEPSKDITRGESESDVKKLIRLNAKYEVELPNSRAFSPPKKVMSDR